MMVGCAIIDVDDGTTQHDYTSNPWRSRRADRSIDPTYTDACPRELDEAELALFCITLPAPPFS